jgi:DNA-binding response OmpR family regulator
MNYFPHHPLPAILLVEDSESDRDLFELALAHSGVEAQLTCVESVTEAVMRINRMGVFATTPPISVIVLDLSLSGENGMALLRLLRRGNTENPIPVAVLTGSKLTADRFECDALGVADYLVKPELFSDLVAFVAALQRFFVPSEHHDLDVTHLTSPRQGRSTPERSERSERKEGSG